MSGRASASTRTRPTRIPISALQRWSKAPDHPRVIAIGECGLDYYYDKSDRAGAARAVPSAYRRGAADRPAAGRPHARRGGGHGRNPRAGGEGRAASPASSTASPARPSLRARASTSASYISLSGIVTFKNAQDLQADGQVAARRPDAGRDGFAVPRAGPAPRPEMRAGLRRRHRSFRRRAEGRGPRSARPRRRRRISSGFSARQRVKLRILGCGTSTGVPKIGNEWGQCDPARAAQSRACAPRSWSKAAASACSSIAGRTFASSCSRRRSDGSTASSSPTPMATIATASTSCGRSSQAIGGPVPMYARADVLEELQAALRLCLRAVGLLSADRRSARRSTTNSDFGDARVALRRSAAWRPDFARTALR